MVAQKINNIIHERRSGERAARVVAVRHRLIKRQAKRIDDVWSLSNTKNMSFSGVLFMSPVEYKQGDLLDLEIVMSGIIDIYRGKAQVIRVVASGSSFDVAVKYVDVNLKEKKPAVRDAKAHIKK